MSRKLGGIVLCAAIMLIVTGCWSRTEIEEIAIVLALGIDKAEAPDRYLLTVQIAVPNQIGKASPGLGGERQPANWVISSAGRTMLDAVRNFAHQVPRRLQWSNLRVIVFGEEMAREGIRDALDFIDRDPQPRRSTLLMVAQGARGSEIMHAFVPIELLTSKALDELLMTSPTMTSTIPIRTVHEILQMFSAPGWEVTMSRVRLSVEQDLDPNQDRLPQSSIPTHHVRVGGTAVFQHDRLVGWLDELETRGLLFVQGEILTGAIVIPCDEAESQLMTIKMQHSSGSIRTAVKDGQIVATISVRMEGNIGDQECHPRVSMNALNERLAKEIEREIRSAFDVLQKKTPSDAFGVGLTLYRRMHDVWKQVEDDWATVFPTIPIEIDVKAMIRREGLVPYPVEIR